MTTPWDKFPADYRSIEVQRITSAVRAGECVSVVGLSGSGKSNLLGFIAHQVAALEGETAVKFVLIDCNRLGTLDPPALYTEVRRQLGDTSRVTDARAQLESLIHRRLVEGPGSLCLLFDRFDLFTTPPHQTVLNNLRVLRDAHKYTLTYVVALRHPLAPDNELVELFYAHTLWLGPLSRSDSLWNVHRYATRLGLDWDDRTAEALIQATAGYPSLLRAACEAHAGGASTDVDSLIEHPAVAHRVAEFWADHPSDEALRNSGLEKQPILMAYRTPRFDISQLTAKEGLLFEYLSQHPNKICGKDELIRAIWPEDKVFDEGVRDESLAQVVRRLRVKIEADPSNPRIIRTVPGRGYLYKI